MSLLRHALEVSNGYLGDLHPASRRHLRSDVLADIAARHVYAMVLLIPGVIRKVCLIRPEDNET